VTGVQTCALPILYCCVAFQIKKQAGNIVVGVETFITKQPVKPALEEIQEKKEEEMKRRIEKEDEARKKRDQKVKEDVEKKRR
jgi:transposase